MQLSTNFHLSEFACKDGSPVPEELIPNITKLAVNLQVLRDYIDEPLHINSGYRSPAHNARVGGKKNSYHLKGMAADITAKSFTPKKLASIIEKLIAEGKVKQGGVGIYKGFIHYDIRGKKSRWIG